MDNSFLIIFDLISIGCGGYILYTYLKLHMAGRLFPNSLLVPTGKSPKDCLDSEAYIRYIKPKMLIIGILVTLFGLVSLLTEYLSFFSANVSLILTGVIFVCIIWYGICSGKANRTYW